MSGAGASIGAATAGAGPTPTAGPMEPTAGGLGGVEPRRPTALNTYIVVQSCPNADLNGRGHYLLLPDKVNGYELYRKRVDGPEAKGHGLHIFYHKNPRKGWSIGMDPNTEEDCLRRSSQTFQDPMAFLGPSTARDPCSRSYAQHWEVLVPLRISGSMIPTKSWIMSLKRIQKTE
eukprot:g28138.t1